MNSCLEGAWRQVAATENGEVIDQHDQITLMVEGSAFTVQRNGELEIEGVFEVDQSEHPTSIDWKDLVGNDSGKIFKSLCVVGEDSFEFCAANEGMPRPERFEASKGHTIRGFQRIRGHRTR